MRREDRSSWMVGFLLTAPLVALVAWLLTGGLSRSFGPEGSALLETGSSATFTLAGFASPSGDFSADRLFERVDGAADALIAAGCSRLVTWQLGEPPVELELLVFDRPEGAARVLERDAGPGRTAGPGDEASADERTVFFRRGRYYARLLADPLRTPVPGALVELARTVDAALLTLSTEPQPGRAESVEERSQ